jgi:CubicO group peptidase (beta-lactamase class C family)
MNSKFSQERLSRMDDVLPGYVTRGETAGFVALAAHRDDVHVVTAGVQDIDAAVPMRRDTIFRVASMTKPVTAVAAMMLVQETKLKLDQPIDRWLPELAGRKVLRSIESAVDDTEPVERPITVRDLLTFRAGIGAVMAMPGTYPIQTAIAEAGVAPGPNPSTLSTDEWLSRLGTLPLIHQPGRQWMYHTSSDILGVLVARASGVSLGEFVGQRIFEPLGMSDTAFYVPDSKMGRFATSYQFTDDGSLAVYDPARGGMWSRQPSFEHGGGGLVSTVDDYLAFGRMLLGGGKLGSVRILARPTVELMMRDHITPGQKAASPFFPGFWDTSGWGFGAAVRTRRDDIGPAEGSFTWTGGFGTFWCVDPAEEMVTIFLNQRMMRGADDLGIIQDFVTLAYQAVE